MTNVRLEIEGAQEDSRHLAAHDTSQHQLTRQAFTRTPEGNMKTTVLAVSVAAFALLPFDHARAQAAFPPPPPKVSPAAGVIDMHVHSHPDVFGRNMDDIDVA